MTTEAAAVVSKARQPWWLSTRAMVAWWILSGLALGFAVGVPPLQRTQEARVLEAAREMLGGGFRGYMVPMLNGNLRVRKPPLSYWLAAGAFNVAGVFEGAGRAPTVVVGWLTLLATFLGAQWLFGRRAGFFASGTLLTSYLFFRHARLAETDAPAMLFVTVAILALWRGAAGEDAGIRGRGDAGSGGGGFWWFHLGAAATALAVMSKGPPGFYPPLFLLAWCAVRKRRAVLLRFVLSGAPVTFIVIAAPWFIYIFKYVGIEQWRMESDELLGGEGHGGTFLVYFPQILQSIAPWFLVVIGALVAAFKNVRRDWRMQGLLLWSAAVFVPLCFIGNKQDHYLLTLMPPLMILGGWWLDWVLTPAYENSRPRVPLLDITMVMSVVGLPAILVGARVVKGRIGFYDIALVVWLALALIGVGVVYLRRGLGGATVAYIFATALVFVPAIGVWVPMSEPSNSRVLARELNRRFGRGPYCFYGNSVSIPLCFNLRTQIPDARDDDELRELASRTPGLVVIAKTASDKLGPALPPEFEPQPPDIRLPEQTFHLYKRH